MKKRFFSIICIMMMILLVPLGAYAFEEPDMDRTGSIRVSLSYEGKPVTGAGMMLYRVAEVVVEKGAEYSFSYVKEYKDCKASLAELSDTELPQILATYTKDNYIEGIQASFDEKGTLSFGDLELGLYLIMQETPAEGFEVIAPFLVSVPVKEQESLVYNVDATPKLTLVQKPVEPEKPVTPPPKLPQTGQLKWPIPLLTAGGLFFLLLGGICIRNERKKFHEK